jgi:uncharacterized SAM-binding protein YcdF (DUF218 family)
MPGKEFLVGGSRDGRIAGAGVAAAGVAADSLYPAGEADAIVVLAGGMTPPAPEQPEALPNPETYERCARAAWLYRNWRRLPVLTCGGPGWKDGEPFGSVMRRVIAGMGVPPEAVWIEDRSTSTHQNAEFSANILRQMGVRRIVLVTSAFHMLRSTRCYEKQGLVVTPAACGFTLLTAELHTLMPGWPGIYRNERTFHEVVGLATYWIRGWV